ncbi:hypothetical protein COU17_02660 [Candidatus Kaiserbacteria bacterium CG10_big_fil_rev_8_21_14_0_10_49_17]|uniref:Uncharacterized protein n=1 Tax=Candidatus Kaiserbacteria bacterium CG10_big_fil_rev_8_21_14_0_10_49_17 TaxID=1974609 RepID=A0A2M6WE74_9BACT|nr:MAG: hypothetical protein COU17_02660 [Candidatus Kaiserbacteria bacterium CG10_big_fil_rev_8_21_14_0_10_49_17]
MVMINESTAIPVAYINQNGAIAYISEWRRWVLIGVDGALKFAPATLTIHTETIEFALEVLGGRTEKVEHVTLREVQRKVSGKSKLASKVAT